MKLQTILLAICFTYVCCHDHEAKIKILEAHSNGTESDETVLIDLKRKDGSEEIQLMAQMRIHLIEGKVHLNGNLLEHGVVNHIHMRLYIIEFKNGIQKEPELKPVQLRILVVEKTLTNGKKVLIIEEEFIKVEEHDVIQVDVKQIIFESMVRKPVTLIRLKESKIHSQPKEEDHHLMFADDKYHPHIPEHPIQGGEEYHHHHHHCHHHHKHHNKLGKAKCWYHRLSWKSKFALFATGFLALLTMILFCCAIKKRLQRRRRTLQVSAPIDDTVAVDMDDVKKDEKKDENFDFHFEFDNSVVVDDKKNLIE